ncbi:MAG: hypothetical protein ACRC0Y_07965 [Fusobacteriaceae bacterium]
MKSSSKPLDWHGDTIFGPLAGVLRKDVSSVIDSFGPINFLTMDEQWKEIGIDGEKHNHLKIFNFIK